MTSLLAHVVTLGATVASHGWHAARAAAGLPATCRQAAAHAAMVCSGMDPVYFSAGFAPLSLAWGWLLLGLLLGALLRPFIGAWMLALLQLAPLARAPVARAPLVQPADARASAAVEVLRCVALGGQDELHALATCAGLTPAALALVTSTRRVEPNREVSECTCRFLFCMLLCLHCFQPAPSAAISSPASSHSAAAPAMAAASRCDVWGLGLWSPATRCEGCSAQARLNHAVAHRIWPAATWRAVGMALSAILAMADAQAETGDGAGERDRARSRSRSRSPHSESSSEAPGLSRPGAPPPAERGPPAEAERPRPRPMERSRPNKSACQASASTSTTWHVLMHRHLGCRSPAPWTPSMRLSSPSSTSWGCSVHCTVARKELA